MSTPKNKIEDALAEASSLTHAMRMACRTMERTVKDTADTCALLMLVDEISVRLNTARDVLDDMEDFRK